MTGGAVPRRLVAGIDAGGTTFKLAVAEPGGPPLGLSRVPTTTPDETIAAAADALRALSRDAGGEIVRLGIASFGPVDVDPASPRYGAILRTPKPGWTGTPLLGRLRDALGVPGDLDTDVNGALEAEALWGAARGVARAAYVTVGTGIGVGVVADGAFAGHPFHPELGHVRVARHEGDREYPGACPFHGDCLEGLAAAPALVARYGPLEALGPDHPAWAVAGHYLGQLCVVLSLGFRAERVVLGGGVMGAPSLLGRVRDAYAGLMNGYLDDAAPDALIVPAGLGGEAGVRGGLAVAQRRLST